MKRLIGLVLVLAVGLWAGMAAAEDAAGAPANETREMLSEHETVAKLTGITYRKCMGLTALCPDNCGQSGDFATFEILAYLSYQKPGEYGDPKATSYMFQVQDNKKNPKIPKEMAEKVNALKPGDTVRLSWRHDYVTRTEGGGSSKFPDRVVTKLEKITPEEAAKLVKEAKEK